MDPKYPDITVQLSGVNGNAFSVMGAVLRALRNAGHTQATADEFITEATSGDYTHLIRTCGKWVNVT